MERHLAQLGSSRECDLAAALEDSSRDIYRNFLRETQESSGDGAKADTAAAVASGGQREMSGSDASLPPKRRRKENSANSAANKSRKAARSSPPDITDPVAKQPMLAAEKKNAPHGARQRLPLHNLTTAVDTDDEELGPVTMLVDSTSSSVDVPDFAAASQSVSAASSSRVRAKKATAKAKANPYVNSREHDVPAGSKNVAFASGMDVGDDGMDIDNDIDKDLAPIRPFEPASGQLFASVASAAGTSSNVPSAGTTADTSAQAHPIAIRQAVPSSSATSDLGRWRYSSSNPPRVGIDPKSLEPTRIMLKNAIMRSGPNSDSQLRVHLEPLLNELEKVLRG